MEQDNDFKKIQHIVNYSTNMFRLHAYNIFIMRSASPWPCLYQR